jgi:enoyl-[acyl-carrier protein] reductase I
MGVLDGKTALIFGVADHHSIAWAIAQKLRDAGATLAFTYMERFEQHVRKLLADWPDPLIMPCDVQNDEQLDAVFAATGERFDGGLDILVHAVAFASRDAFTKRFVETTRDDFKQSLDISAYSLVTMTRRAEPLMIARGGGSVMALTYQASQRVVPNYNLMAISKAALEANVRYLAADVGQNGIRVNAISAGPVRTISAMGVGGVQGLIDQLEERGPLRRGITADDVGDLAQFLASDAAKNITGQVIYVDAGHSILAV